MKLRRVALGVLLVVVVIAAAFVGFRILSGAAGGGKAADPAYALISNPLSQDIVFLGDPTYVQVSGMLTQRDVKGIELRVNDEAYITPAEYAGDAPLQEFSCASNDQQFCGPVETSVLWIPSEAGAISLTACFSGDNASTPAWQLCSDPVRVVVVDPAAAPPLAGTYAAKEGDSIESVATNLGLPPFLVAAANPEIDPAGPLPTGTELKIPADPSFLPPDASSPGASPGTGPWTVKEAGISTSQPIDKGYCYYSFDSSYWSRVPAGPQTFVYPINGNLDLGPQLSAATVPPAGGTLAMECWGWIGSTLIPLGSGRTTVSPAVSPAIQLNGEHFALEVLLVTRGGEYDPRTIKYVVPPPLSVTATSNLETCLKHIPSEGFEVIFLTLMCKTAVENNDTILVWDWVAPIFPPSTPDTVWYTKVDGYRVYMVVPGGKPKALGTIHDQRQTNFDMPFLKKMIMVGKPCFFVRAYVGPLESVNSNTYCLGGTAAGLATVTLDPSNVQYGGQQKSKTSSIGFCSVGIPTIVSSPFVKGDNFPVGYVHSSTPASCLEAYWEYSRAQVQFDLSAVPGPVSSAELSYRMDYTSSPGNSCARRMGTTPTTASGVHVKDMVFEPYTLLPTSAYSGATFKWTVTDVVRNWQLGSPNGGFIFLGGDEGLSLPACGGIGEDGCIEGVDTCWSTYGAAQLKVTYFVP